MADRYDRIGNGLTVYGRGLPEGADFMNHLKARAERLELGRDNPIMENLAGMAVGSALGASPLSVVPGLATGGGMAAGTATGKGMKEMDRRNRIRSIKDMDFNLDF